MTYFNTTHESGEKLADYRRTALSQELRIRSFWARHPKKLFAPSDMHEYVFDGAVPLTSVRRAFSVLGDDNFIVKTDKMIEGPFGRSEHLWRLACHE